jgi:hypothetical protein
MRCRANRGHRIYQRCPASKCSVRARIWDLKRTVDDNHLQVETLIGMHMSPTPWSKLIGTLARASAPPVPVSGAAH